MKKIYKLLVTLILSVISLFTTFAPAVATASAEGETKYSSVMDDLTKAENFNSGDYPSISNPLNADGTKNKKYSSIEVIQIAESVDKELFVYTYQPAHEVLDLQATSIALWEGFSSNGKDFTPIEYKLELLSTQGVFDKYLVKDFQVSDEGKRYYNISTIWREVDESVDDGVVGGERTEIGLPVGQQYLFYWFNDEYICEKGVFSLLEIDITYWDYIDFKSKHIFDWYPTTDLYRAHYLAFNEQDYVIEKIFNATVSYDAVPEKMMYHYSSDTTSYTYGDPVPTTAKLTSNDTIQVSGSGLFKSEFKWNRIMSSATFISTLTDQGVSLSTEAVTELTKSKWVFSFAETELTKQSQPAGSITNGTTVRNATVLQLEFMDIHQKYYNLAVVGDKGTADNVPGAVVNLDTSGIEELLKLLAMVLGLIVIVLFINPIMSLLGILLKVFKVALDFVLWLISAPFKLLGLLFGGNKKR